jgi:hypothetical protein
MRAFNFGIYGHARPAETAVCTAVPCILLTRKRSQVQTLSRPPLFSLVKDLSAPSGQRSLRAAAAPRPQAAPPPNGWALRSSPPPDHPSPNDHSAWSPPPWSRPLGQHHAGDLPGRPAGTGEHLLGRVLPRHLARHPGPGPGPASARWGQDGSAAGTLAKRRPWLRSISCEPATANAAASPSRPARCRQATTPPTGHGGTSTRCARPGRSATPSHSGVQGADRAAAAPRTPEPVRPDTWMPRTPGHRTPGHRTRGHRTRGRWMSARPVGRTSHGGPDEADRATTGLAGVRTPRARRAPLGGPTSPGSRRLGRSATQDGSAAMAPAPRP